jgi:CRISPR-associated protein Csm4
MSTEIIRMEFFSGLHIGRGFEELDKTATTYSSDALKSALFAIGLPYNPEWEIDEKIFFEGFKISSAFPFYGNEYFLPKPGGMKFNFSSANDLNEAKKAKKINYVSTKIFDQWVLTPEKPINVLEEQVCDGSYLFSGTAAKKFLHTTVQQRVIVSTEENSNTRPYYFERLLFAEGSGLYFFIEFQNADLKPKVMHALRLLGDAGIGTDRTVGNGQFSVSQPQSFNLPKSNIKGQQLALGLYLPTREELSNLDLAECNWSLVRRGGFMAASDNINFSGLRKKSIYLFAEGSIFKSKTLLKGRYVDLKPEWNTLEMHPVWRCGSPLFINL